jgi:hypothetical protein
LKLSMFYACMFIWPKNHAHQLQLAATTPKYKFFPYLN